jgi:hypothetical protein
MSCGGFRQALAPRQLVYTVRQLKETGDYIQSGRDAGDPATRTATIRAAMEALLSAALADESTDGLDPFLDFIVEKIVTESAPEQAVPAVPAAQTRPAAEST